MERGSVRETVDRAHDGCLSRSRGCGDRFRYNLAQSSSQYAVPEQRRRGVRDQRSGRSIATKIQQTRGGMATEYQISGGWYSGATSRVGRAGGFRWNRAPSTYRLSCRRGSRRGPQAVSLWDSRSRDFTFLSSGLKDFLELNILCRADRHETRIGKRPRRFEE